MDLSVTGTGEMCSHRGERKLDPSPLKAKTNPKWIRNLNRKRKLENTKRKHKWVFKEYDRIGMGKPFLNITVNPEAIKQKANIQPHKNKTFLHSQNHKKSTQRHRSWAKDIFP